MCVYKGSVSFQREMSEMCHYQCIVMIINQYFPVDLNLTHWPISPATTSFFRDFITGTKDYKHIEILVKKKSPGPISHNTHGMCKTVTDPTYISCNCQ